uniref:hypothetical protein n=1 Tax=Treponema primitia TaxID=88058 RepID=UPI0002555850
WYQAPFLALILLCVAGCGNPILRDAWITESNPVTEEPLVDPGLPGGWAVDQGALTAVITAAETLIAGTASGEDVAEIPLGVHFVTGAEKAAYQAAIDAARAARDDGAATAAQIDQAALDLAAASGVFTAAAAAKTGTKPGPAPILGVVAVSFDGAVYGDERPGAKPITITNSGTGAAAISAVELSGGGKDAFALGGSGDTVAVGDSITTWTVQPAAALAAGIYTATITVGYDDGAAATAQVSITISKAAGGAVGTPGGDSAGTTITVTALTVSNGEQAPEYAISTGTNAPDTGWQTGLTFADLDPGVTYYMYARAGESANYGVGAAVRSAAITVGKLSQAAFGFSVGTVDKTYGDAPVPYTATGGSGDGGISYAVTGSDGAVSVDAASGAVSFLKAGTGYITATKAGDATYNAATATLTVNISKATPTYAAPTGLSAFVGQTLADVTLSEGFSWDTVKNPLTTAVGGVGSNTFKAKYTPDDTGNYLVAEDIPVNIIVTAKTLTITVSLNLSRDVTLEGASGGITLSRTGTGATKTAEIKAEGYTNVKWYVDGVAAVDAVLSDEGNSITLSAGAYDVRRHQVLFRGVQDGSTYSKEISFTVSE